MSRSVEGARTQAGKEAQPAARYFWSLAAVAGILAALPGSSSAGTAIVQHGITFTKSCASPTNIGDPDSCSYVIRNIVDEAQDTLTITALSDVVHSSGGDVSSGNILSAVQLTVTGGATCTGGTGSGTVGSPFVGVSSCTLPFSSQINVLSVSHYTVQSGDFSLPSHILTDSATLGWHDLCDDPGGTSNTNCMTDPPAEGAGSQTTVQLLISSTTTQIHDAAHNVVTMVLPGSVVHDFVTVTGQPGSPNPSGNVGIDLFANGDCMGSPSTSSTVALNANGEVEGSTYTVSSGAYAFKAHYLGDATYAGSDGPCEALLAVSETATPTATSTPTMTPLGLGLGCTIGSQCASGFCVDQVCCDQACTGQLLQCNLPPDLGTCQSSARVPVSSHLGVLLLILTLLIGGAVALRIRRHRAPTA